MMVVMIVTTMMKTRVVMGVMMAVMMVRTVIETMMKMVVVMRMMVVSTLERTSVCRDLCWAFNILHIIKCIHQPCCLQPRASRHFSSK